MRRAHRQIALYLSGALLWSGCAHARNMEEPAIQPPAPDTPSQTASAAAASSVPAVAPSVGVSGLLISGNNAISNDVFLPLAEKYFGEEITEELLARLIGEVADISKEQGYPFAEPYLANDGSDGGIVQIELDEGHIDSVRIEGYENARALEILHPLAGRPANGAELEERLIRVSDIPAVRFRNARLERDADVSVLVVTLQKRDDDIRLQADNYGTKAFGPVRAKLIYQGRAIFASADALETSIRINPVEFDEFKYVSATYSTEIGKDGTRIEFEGSVGDTVPGGNFDGSDIEGESARARIAVTHPLVRTKTTRVDIEGAAAYLTIKQDDIDNLLRDDTIVTASIGLFAQTQLDDARVRGRINFTRGVDVLGATRLGDPLSSRSDGDGVFTLAELFADVLIPVIPRTSLYFAGRGQLADRPLLSSEEFTLGGAYRVRGYDFREVSGDNGIHALAELRYDVPTKGTEFKYLQLYGFIEGGQVWDIDTTLGEGTLYAAGSGVRARVGRFNFEVESALPLGGSGERTTDNSAAVNIRAGFDF